MVGTVIMWGYSRLWCGVLTYMVESTLPLGSTIAIFVMVAAPILTYVLYRIDLMNGDGHVTVFGRGGQ